MEYSKVLKKIVMMEDFWKEESTQLNESSLPEKKNAFLADSLWEISLVTYQAKHLT